MEIKEITPYRIPEIFLSAMFNGDISGLEDDDINKWNKFEERIDSEYNSYTWSIPEDDFESYFTQFHDVPGILACNCVDIDLIVWEG